VDEQAKCITLDIVQLHVLSLTLDHVLLKAASKNGE
jgi:hypothetical protein